MKIKDILATGKPSVSFEVFPPKKDAPFEPVRDAVARLALQKPSFMSVTYGASGNAQANTVEIASFVQKCDVPALAHLTCLSSSRDRIAEELKTLRTAGVENILCLRGDLPKDASEPPPGHFNHAVDLPSVCDRHYARDHRHRYSPAAELCEIPVEYVVVEEHLRRDEIQPGIHLLAEMGDVVLHVCAVGMTFGIAGAAETER